MIIAQGYWNGSFFEEDSEFRTDGTCLSCGEPKDKHEEVVVIPADEHTLLLTEADIDD